MGLQTYRSKILGTGSYLPERVVTNYDYEKIMDTTHEWIVERTGIHRRHFTKDNEYTSDIALRAAQKALEASNLSPQDLDLIIFGTATPDQPIPNTACELQKKLGCPPIGAFDLNAACSGFIYSLSVADQFIRTGMYKTILVVGAEVTKNCIDYEDRTTAILFGDAAGAVVVGRVDESSQSQIYSSHLHADGNLGDLFVLPYGGSKMPPTQELIDTKKWAVSMKGKEIFKHAVKMMGQCCQEALEKNNYRVQDIDWLVPHQANLRIIEATGKHIGVPPEQVIVTVHETGNTSAGTVPVALDVAVRDGRIQRGDLVMLVAFGGGITSASLLVRY